MIYGHPKWCLCASLCVLGRDVFPCYSLLTLCSQLCHFLPKDQCIWGVRETDDLLQGGCSQMIPQSHNRASTNNEQCLWGLGSFRSALTYACKAQTSGLTHRRLFSDRTTAFHNLGKHRPPLSKISAEGPITVHSIMGHCNETEIIKSICVWNWFKWGNEFILFFSEWDQAFRIKGDKEQRSQKAMNVGSRC